MTDPSPLASVLASIQARGAIGTSTIEEAIAHAGRFVSQVPAGPGTLADLGSGGGLPGLVIAVARPDLQVTLVERRQQRADLLRRAVAALELGDRVVVHGEDVATLARVAAGTFSVVTARSFAAPAVTAKWASVLLREGGLLLVSEPPEPDPARWPVVLLQPLHLEDRGAEQGIRGFVRR
ncbi:MAG: class I SAM-dependent methyltransferase [Rhodocyclaceae bacterium]|nr:class I SAM-dependent methyltransferase [Rhodocyclaceae bacterium]MCB9381811.1 class I SAM-dependent methyltransferase [Acidimicrobiaceae bacterium]